MTWAPVRVLQGCRWHVPTVTVRRGRLIPQERPKPRVPIVHFRDARPPFVICVKLVSLVYSVGSTAVWLRPGPGHGRGGGSI